MQDIATERLLQEKKVYYSLKKIRIISKVEFVVLVLSLKRIKMVPKIY